MVLRLVPMAFRSLARNKRRSFFTLLAITVGVAVVIFANGFGTGLLDMMVTQTINAQTGALQVHRKGYMDSIEAAPLKLDLPMEGEVLEKVRSTPGVRAVSRRIRFGGMMTNGSRGSMVVGQAFELPEEFKVCPERPNEVRGTGTHLRVEVPQGAVLGGELAKSYDAAPGSTLVITAAGPKGGINALDVEVVGVTRGAAPMQSKRLVSLPLAHAQDLLGMKDRVTEYAVAVNNMKEANEVAERLRASLGPDYEVSTWEEVVPFMRDAQFRLKVVLRGIILVLFLIVLFGVVNTMLMSVFERVREIGTMLAVGLRRRHVMWLFLLEAASLGSVGGAIGASLGFALSAYYNATGINLTPPGSTFQQVIRPEASPLFALLTVVAAAAGAMLAAAYPARKAGLMNPVDALRTS